MSEFFNSLPLYKKLNWNHRKVKSLTLIGLIIGRIRSSIHFSSQKVGELIQKKTKMMVILSWLLVAKQKLLLL